MKKLFWGKTFIWYNRCMASSDFLRHNTNQHAIKNALSKYMDKDIIRATDITMAALAKKYPNLEFTWIKSIKLTEVITILSMQFPEYANQFGVPQNSSFISPDGGFLFAKNNKGERRIVLVSEVKRQGTNDARLKEGLEIQAKGNAIERLGKNLIGVRAMFKNEGVIPFVVFGHGWDFRSGSTILDRVLTMNDFFPLNKEFVSKDYLPFEPVTMCFRYEPWSIEEMAKILTKTAISAIENKFVV